jgi:hypothetical protein
VHGSDVSTAGPKNTVPILFARRFKPQEIILVALPLQILADRGGVALVKFGEAAGEADTAADTERAARPSCEPGGRALSRPDGTARPPPCRQDAAEVGGRGFEWRGPMDTWYSRHTALQTDLGGILRAVCRCRVGSTPAQRLSRTHVCLFCAGPPHGAWVTPQMNQSWPL